MNDWLSPDSPIPFPQHVADPKARACDPRRLRAWDLGLAILAGMVLLLAFPLLLWAASTAQPDHQRMQGAGQRGFTRLRWRFAEGFGARWLERLGATDWPALVNILRGDMAWVGPRPRRLDEPSGPAAHLRPGLTGLHQLRQATCVDFMREELSDAAYLANRGLSHDARLLMLCAWHHRRHARKGSLGEASRKVRILDVQVDNLNMEEAVQGVLQLIEAKHPTQVSFVNPACANIAAGDEQYRQDLADCAMVLPDGIGMKIAGDWLGTPIRQNVNGTDFFPRLCNAMNEKSLRLYLVGARPDVVKRVAEVVGTRWPRIEIVGAQHGYFLPEEELSIAQDIRESNADVVLVAMGVPMQERFLARNRNAMGACVGIGVGGLFDFVAGRISRAPQWMRDAGLEWVWRLLQEPGRMWKRYLLGNFTFLARVAMQRNGLRPTQIASTGPRQQTSEPVSARGTAILLATHAIDPDGNGACLSATLPFGPASFAQNIVAQLATHCIRDIHVITAPDGPPVQLLRQQLGDGQRWGVKIHWHRSAKADLPFQPLRAIANALLPEQAVWLIQAHTWLHAPAVNSLAGSPGVVVQIACDRTIECQGWACIQAKHLAGISHTSSLTTLNEVLTIQVSGRHWVRSIDCASANDRNAWVLAQSTVPAASLLSLQTDVWTAHPWGYASVHSHVSPQAHIEGPVWIGPGCVVQADAQIGPHVTLSRNVVVRRHGVVSHAVVLPGACISKVHGSDTVAADLPQLSQPPLGSKPESLAEPTSQLTQPPLQTSEFACLLAAMLLPLILPVLMLRGLTGRGPGWVFERVVQGEHGGLAGVATTTLRQPPNPMKPGGWLALYGALLDVAEGRRHWMGVRARRLEEWFALDHETRQALAFARIGMWHPKAWTDRLDCDLLAKAAADRLWLARQSRADLRTSWVETPVALMASLAPALSHGHRLSAD